jgi:cysteine desulfurase
VTSTGIYLDHAATTPVDPAVLEAMLPFFTQRFGNPTSIYTAGRDARAGMDWARGSIAKILNCLPREIVMTGGATEANNTAIRGVAWWHRLNGVGNHIITSAIEHHAVLHVVEGLKVHGFDVSFVGADRFGTVDPDDIKAAIRPDTCLISVMYANNEIGTVQPVQEIARIAREHGITMHSDAVQAAGALPLDVETLGVDLLSLSAHKFYAPKGVGLLYVRRGTKVAWQQLGGGQENARRAGTENVPGIIGMAAGLTIAVEEMESRNAHAQLLRDRLIERILERVPDATLNGHPENRLPNNVNISFTGVEGESILLDLDMHSIAASSGSACATGSTEPSHVLRAIGVSEERAQGSLRLTVGKDNTIAEIDRAAEVVSGSVQRLREMKALVS